MKLLGEHDLEVLEHAVGVADGERQRWADFEHTATWP